MPKDQKQTYSVVLGVERIAEIREISRLTGLQQAQIFRRLWDRHKYSVIQEMLEENEENLDARMKGTKKVMREIQAQLKNVA